MLSFSRFPHDSLFISPSPTHPPSPRHFLPNGSLTSPSGRALLDLDGR
jgi:hypothetical protein